jgi:hypothetical protein
MREHVPIEQPEICKLLPQVAGHFIDQRCLAVNDFIVREGQHKVFGEGVEHREGHPVVVIFPVDRVLRHVAERVVHPPHVPLQAESQPAQIRGTRNHWPSRGFFCDRQHSGMARMQDFVHSPQEGNRGKVLSPAEFIGDPFAFTAGIIQVQHGCHGVHAQSIYVEFVNPKQRIGN